MKQVFVQKILDGKPKGRKQKLQIAPDEMVFDFIEKSYLLLNFPEDSRLIVQLDDKILEEKDSLCNVEEYSTLLVSEEKEEEEVSSIQSEQKNGGKLTRTLFLQHQQRGVEKKIELSREERIYEVKAIARQLFTLTEEHCVTILDDKEKVLPSGKKLSDVPDFATLTLIEKDYQEEMQEQDSATEKEDLSGKTPQRQWTEEELKEISILKEKVNCSCVYILFSSFD